MSGAASRVRMRVSVEGVVQGVGFRPFVHRLAERHRLAGWVRNESAGVLLEAEGAAEAMQGFLRELAERPPRLASVRRLSAQPLAVRGERGFRILPSAGGSGAAADGSHDAAGPIPADVAPCEACLRELLDPTDRRHRYPFINCTDCGPRFTIVRATPYDRRATTMAGFTMCELCRQEYEDPSSRRFHAEPNACPECGPTLRLIDATGRPAAAPGEDVVAATARALTGGAIVALKGVGGYQLACRADDGAIVRELRRRKGREEKPLALLAADVATLGRLVELSPEGERLAGGPERPIVLAPRRADAPVAAEVAPGLRELGVMLPATPLHHLLALDVGMPLVVTSGNLGGEPIAIDDEVALERLGPVADLLLVHDRPIRARADDSLVRAGGPVLRRARGYVPRSLGLPVAAATPLLACGAELKSTFCLAGGGRAWVGPHVGDLGDWETLRAFQEGIARFQELLDIEPALVAHDLHPDYHSSVWAAGHEGVELMAVQHHHAHLAAVLAEHGRTGPALGAVYDGAGLGLDGTVWGGELLAGGLGGARRVGHLLAVPLPGGDAAARQPWRMACSWLAAAGAQEPPQGLAEGIDRERWEEVAALAASGVASPPTSSVGRLFDAVAALCAIRLECRDEGLAAMELEAAADPRETGAYPLAVSDGETVLLDPRETVLAIAGELQEGVDPALVSARFHNALADATAAALVLLAEREGVATAVLCGGVFQNRLLAERCGERLVAARLGVLTARELPPGDGAISYGQAAVAAARLAGREAAQT